MYAYLGVLATRATLCILVCAIILCCVLRYSKPKLVCWKDIADNERFVCRRVCPNGTFSLTGTSDCYPYLSCKDIKDDVQILGLLTRGVVKNIYLAKWKGHRVVFSNVTDPRYEADFQHNVRMHQLLGHPDYTVQSLGSCENSMVTEHMPLGPAEHLQDLLGSKLSKYDTVAQRFSLCLSYVSILRHLHAHDRVMCDSNTLSKTLSQYLVQTDLTLRVNDLDALPWATANQKAACGNGTLYGELVPPEQRGPNEPLCDTKCDVWKIPHVCLWFLGSSKHVEGLKFRLFPVHRSCKEHFPEHRPSSDEVFQEYRKIWLHWEAGL